VTLPQVSQQDITFIAAFLKRFQPVESTTGGAAVSHLYLEKVGQYLEDAPLAQPPDNSANPWHQVQWYRYYVLYLYRPQLLADHPEIQEVPFIIPVNTGTSLVQEHGRLAEAVGLVFTGLGRDLGARTEVAASLALPGAVAFTARQQVTDQLTVHGIVTLAEGELLVWRSDHRGQGTEPATATLRLRLPAGQRVVDSSFYTAEFLALLLEDDGQEGQTLLQLPLASLGPLLVTVPEGAVEPVEGAVEAVEAVPGARSRALESLPARQLAVSGPRKVSVFLFKNKKRIRIYDMEGEEEEEEDTLESSGFSASMDVASSQLG
jgi:hypothetical protein